MTCEVKPETVDLDQCRRCKSASGKLLWCCRHGFYLQPTKGEAAMRGPKRRVQGEMQVVKVPDELPGTITMARNLAGATARHVANRLKTRSPEQVEKLMQVCRKCDLSVGIDGQLRCKDCGCYMARKVKWESEVCRLGFWDKALRAYTDVPYPL